MIKDIKEPKTYAVLVCCMLCECGHKLYLSKQMQELLRTEVVKLKCGECGKTLVWNDRKKEEGDVL